MHPYPTSDSSSHTECGRTETGWGGSSLFGLRFFFFFQQTFFFFFLAVLGLRFCARPFSSCGKRGPLFIVVHGPLTIAGLLRSTGSRRAGSVIVAHGPSCSVACGIFPDQGSNPCPLHWQADSQPLRHQGSPGLRFYPPRVSFSLGYSGPRGKGCLPVGSGAFM